MSAATLPPPVLVQAVRQLLLALRTAAGVDEAEVVDIALAVFPAGGSALAAGDDGLELRVGVNAALRPVEWSLSLDQSGAATVDVRDHTGTSICGGALPAVSGAQRIADQTAAAWDQIGDKVWLHAHVTAADGTVQTATVTIRARKL